MKKRQSAIALLIALAAMSAHAQNAPGRVITTSQSDVFTGQNTEVLPVWNNHSGKVEALLLLQPAQQANGSVLFGTGAGVNTGHGILQTNVTAQAGNGLALLCNSSTGLVTLGSLAGQCLVAAVDSANGHDSFGHSSNSAQSQALRAEARFERPESLFALSVGQANLNMNGADWLSPNAGLVPGLSILDGRLSQQDVTASGKMLLGENGWVSIGGTLARAQLIPTAGQGNSAEAQHWNTSSVGVAVGHGKFSGEILGSVVDLPGQSNALSSFGVGLSWRTPVGKFTFGANKSTGNSPLTPATKPALPDEGTVPYVQYHQDL